MEIYWIVEFCFLCRLEQEMNDLMSVNGKDVKTVFVNSMDDIFYKHSHKIGLAEVQTTVQKLQLGKSVCVDGFVSDNLINENKNKNKNEFITITETMMEIIHY